MKRKTSKIERSLAPLWGIDGTATCIVPPAAHKARGLRTIATVLLFWLTTANAQITLNGNLLTDAEKPVPDTKVGVAAGPSNTTDSKGQFSIKLSLDFIEGERVFLVVEKPNWVINYPLDGEWNLPAKKLQEVPQQYTKVIIVPKGSKALWTHARIEKHIALLSDEIAKLKKEGDTPKPIDFKYYLSEWANKYGFTPAEVKTAFDQWAKDVENSEDFRTLGLRAFYEKNFVEAATNFEKAAKQGTTQLKALREETRQVTLATYANWKDAGNMLYNLYRFPEALAKYDSARSLVTRTDYPNEWAEIRVFIGNTKQDIGIRTEGAKATNFLKESEQAYREAFEIYTHEQLPQEWAMVQNNLGNVLKEQGIRTTGEEGEMLLTKAVDAYHQALTVRIREKFPQDWAMTQNNLGTALQEQGIRLSGEEGAKFLSQAVESYQLSLEVRTREQLPQDWAMTQNNLGLALQEQGIRSVGEASAELLRQAVAAYQNALQVYDREQLPQDWAMTQNNLGLVLQEQGIRTVGEASAESLNQAIRAYQNALQVYTREQQPQRWATIQNNLGNALSEQGIRTSGETGLSLLAQAVMVYRTALQVRTYEELPQYWAVTQNNLGNVLKEQGIRTVGAEGVKLLAEAVDAYRQALMVYTREQLPQQWATTQNNLGHALKEQSIRTVGDEGAKLLTEAVTAYENALQVFTYEHTPLHWAMTQNNLAEAFVYLEKWSEVAACYSNVLRVHPNFVKAYQTAKYLYHEELFNFPEAFVLNQNWLAQFPEDLSAHCDFAEKHFTTSRFAECEQRLASLLENAEVEPRVKIALRIIGIANALAQNKMQQVPTELETLQAAIAAHPDTFKVGWTFNGVKHFISTNETLAPHREWLLQFFAAIERKEGREAILAGLEGVRKNFSAAK